MSLLVATNISRSYSRLSLVGSAKPKLALEQVSIAVEAGETLALLGRSGCGKSTLVRLLAGLEKPDSGEVRFEGKPLARLSKPERAVFRRSVQMVFQDSFGAVDPRCTIGEIIAEPLRHLLGLNAKACAARTAELLWKVGLEPGETKKLPQQMSGGQLQRVCIARALAPQPRLVILDEAVSNVDLHQQVQLLDLFDRLARDTHVAWLFVTHDLRLVERFCSRIVVMDAGRICEETVVARPLQLASATGRALQEAILPALPHVLTPKPVPGSGDRL
ncbi:nickel ABC transporter ATP-binding protein NikE [Aquamicrobium segne]|uniref:Nickel ABC transporter ATP-binding protein NikE n=1 Tax=Aquamicrobium segne TaxID=469547 RepID=A0ABW0GYW4_9HYPH